MSFFFQDFYRVEWFNWHKTMLACFAMADITILKGLVGSKAYGLDHADSDDDFLGIYVAPTTEILRFTGYTDKQSTRVEHEPDDFTLHEIGKYLKLAANGNPTVLELLFLDDYLIQTQTGKLLVENRDMLLSNIVFKTYGGYATQQMERLERRGDGSFSSDLRKRKEKHARHLARLITQCKELVTTGKITVRLENPEYIRSIGELPDDQIREWFDQNIAELDALESVLPEKPDYERINDFLLEVRSDIGASTLLNRR